MKEQFFKWLNLALVADFFLVLLIFFWLAIAVASHVLNLPLGLDLWYKLWQLVFTSVIGILIAGTLISGVSGWVSKRFNSQQLN